MEDIFINPEWKYKEVVEIIETLKSQYKGILASFSYFEIHSKVEWVYSLKRRVYELNFEEWRRNKIWEYLNGDEELEILQKLV